MLKLMYIQRDGTSSSLHPTGHQLFSQIQYGASPASAQDHRGAINLAKCHQEDRNEVSRRETHVPAEFQCNCID